MCSALPPCLTLGPLHSQELSASSPQILETVTMAENMKPLKGFKQGSDAIGPRKGFSCYCEGWAGKEEPVSDTTEALVNAENGN